MTTVGEVQQGTELNGIYRIDEKIAVGGMGEVYRGHNIQTNDPVAIKIVLPEFARDETILALFRKEASVLNHLSHEAIVRYHVFSIDAGIARPYLAMEFVDGESLGDRAGREAFTVAETITLTKHLASGLQTAHNAGVIHRDLSPDNIIISRGEVGRAKIIDFGIAKSAQVGGGTLLGGKFAGKYNFVSPEQLGLFGGEVTPKSDIYSLGLVVAAALRGAPLDMSGTQVDVIEKRRHVPDLSGVDATLLPLITAMLQPDPEHRPASMSEIADWLIALKSQGSSQAPVAPVFHQSPETPLNTAEPQQSSGAPSTQESTPPPTSIPDTPPPPPPPTVTSQPPVTASEPTVYSGSPVVANTANEAVAVLAGQATVLNDGPPVTGFGDQSIPARRTADQLEGQGAPMPAPVHAQQVSPPETGAYDPVMSQPPAPDNGELPRASFQPTAGTGGAQPAIPTTMVKPEKKGGRFGLLAGVAILIVALGGGGAYYYTTMVKKAEKVAGTDTQPGLTPTVTDEDKDKTGVGGNKDQAGGQTGDGDRENTDGTKDGEKETIDQPDPDKKTPETVVVQAATMMETVENFQDGKCFYAGAKEIGDKQLSIEGFGLSIAPFEKLEKLVSDTHGIEPDISMRPIVESQCSVVDFLGDIRPYETVKPALNLSNDWIKSGDSLRGSVSNIGDKVLSILLIDNQGVAYNLGPHLNRTGDRADFNIKLVDLAPRDPLPQLILAIASDKEIETLKRDKPALAKSYFPEVLKALRRSNGDFGSAMKFFKLGG